MSHEYTHRSGKITSIISTSSERKRDESANPELQCVMLDHLLAERGYHLVALDDKGVITWSNVFEGKSRGCNQREHKPLLAARIGESFTGIFRQAASLGDGVAAEALSGILGVIKGREDSFEMDYPCVSNESLCWYRMRVATFPQRSEIIVSYHDVTERKRLEHEVRRYRQQFTRENGLRSRQAERRNGEYRAAPIGPWLNDSVFKQATAVFINSSESVVITDANLRIVNVNDGFINTTGFSHDEVIGSDIGILGLRCLEDNTPESEICHAVKLYGHWQGELKTSRRNNDSFYSWATIDEVLDENGNPENYIFVLSDITRIKESQARIHYLAHHDPLTGLANRLLFWALLEQSIEHAARHSNRVALVCLDIDNFKLINDRMGHPVGDHLLRIIAERLSTEVRGADTIARMGGDEFALIAEDISSHADMETFVRKLKAKLADEVVLDGVPVKPSTSVGFALYPDEGLTPESLYKAADQMMYRNKSASRETEQDIGWSPTQSTAEALGKVPTDASVSPQPTEVSTG